MMTVSNQPLSQGRLEEILAGFPQLTIGLLGDLFLDRYLFIDPRSQELSIETGLEAYQITRVGNQPGALGTVMSNLAALGVGRLAPATVIGEDGHGYDLLKSLDPLPVDKRFILQQSDRLTPTYTKPMRRAAEDEMVELNRLDVRTFAPVDPVVSRQVASHVDALFAETDGIIVLDQVNETDWGVVNSEVRRTLEQACQRQPDKVVFVDSRKHLREFSCGILKGNEAEMRGAAQRGAGLNEALQKIRQETACPVYCTRGEEGILVSTSEEEPVAVPGYPVDGPVDIVGAGDSTTSGIVASLLVGADPIEAAIVGNLVASVTVQKLGTTGTATPDEVIARFREVAQVS